MIDASRLDQRILPLIQRGVVQGFENIDHDLLIRISFEGQAVIVRHEREGFRSYMPCVETIDLFFSLFQHLVTLLVLAGKLQCHPTIHPVEHAALRSVFVLRLLDDCIGLLVVAREETVIDENIAVTRSSTASQQYTEDQRGELSTNTNAPPCRGMSSGA